MKINKWIAKGQYHAYKGHNIFYIYENHQAPKTILFIHGFPTCSWDWAKIWTRLGTKYNLLTLDMIGYGMSDKPYDYEYSIVDQAVLILDLLKKIELKDLYIFAHDYGDSVAQEILYRTLDPKKHNIEWLQVHKICFLNGGMFPDVYYPKFIQKLLLSPLGGFVTHFLTKRTLHQNFKDIFGKNTQPTQEEIDVFWDMMNRKGGRKIVHKIIQYLHERKRELGRWVKAMQATNIPLRLIDGAVDPISGRHMAERYIELIPNPDVIILDEIGHYPNVEAPDEVLQHFLEFIEA